MVVLQSSSAGAAAARTSELHAGGSGAGIGCERRGGVQPWQGLGSWGGATWEKLNAAWDTAATAGRTSSSAAATDAAAAAVDHTSQQVGTGRREGSTSNGRALHGGRRLWVWELLVQVLLVLLLVLGVLGVLWRWQRVRMDMRRGLALQLLVAKDRLLLLQSDGGGVKSTVYRSILAAAATASHHRHTRGRMLQGALARVIFVLLCRKEAVGKGFSAPNRRSSLHLHLLLLR
jgi:hypothetical protein